MSAYSRLQVYNALIKSGFVPLFYTDDPTHAQTFVQACVRGGVQAVEFTNRGGQALSVFTHLRAVFPQLILGIGSIVDAPTAALYIAHGANFIVSPSFNADVAELCNLRKVPYLPGCATATEIQTAHRYGVEIIKLFPANLYSPAFVRALKAPMAWTRIMPTGGIGISQAEIEAWFSAGVSCVGIGSQLATVPDISATCAQILGWIAAARKDDAHAL